MAIPRVWARPSRIREYIVRLHPQGLPAPDTGGPSFPEAYSGPLRGLLELIDAVDPVVLMEGFTPDDVALWHMAVGELRQKVAQWVSNLTMERITLSRIQALPDPPLVVIHNLLAKCPDVATPRAAARLTFIQDNTLRDNIARDVDSVESLLRQEEWKAATVIAGSLIEAFLLSEMEKDFQKKGDDPQAYAASKKWLTRSGVARKIDEWELEQFLQAAKDRGVIDADDERPCRATQNYRNLIHPGRERLKEKFDEGTALVAVGAVKRLMTKFGP